MWKKGFTLIELLVTIGVLAVVASGVVALIDPVDKNRAAQDAKVQNDIGQLATALQAYAATNDGVYPAALPTLVSTGDLTSIPVPPTAYNCNGTTNTYAGGYVDQSGGAFTSVTLGCVLRSKKYTRDTATDNWVWCSSTGRVDSVGTYTTCP